MFACFKTELEAFSLDVNLWLPAKGVTALFGHSGSGKTTLLRCIAGLHQAKGDLKINGECWQSAGFFLPVHKRPLAYVFQEASLFPHLSVRRNLEYGYRRVPEGERQVTFEQAVAWLGLGEMLTRMPDKLSGGERQRVAIARALLTSPRLLLMDEPLSALDHNSKQEIMPYLERLHEVLSIPVLYVTHSPEEVARLADHLVVLDAGRVVASGELSETLASLDLPVKLGENAGVVLKATVSELDDEWHLCCASFPGGELWLPNEGFQLDQPIRLRVLARDVSVALSKHEDQSMLNVLPAVVESVSENDRPGAVMVKLDLNAAEGEALGCTSMLARLTARSVDKLQLVPGKSAWVQVKSVAVLE
ncbi:molybdenum ABC transporter ATP-binding protein [Pontibacterium sp. N1Y112]|uniref:Molybdenum ABC transporter ATP-binding protein n=1 Tax=Pontibacterium sinense TaxID=2781979 RepID=A0A8J7FD49_9GAMM|nr:molybdenum ABC transporter ATP-binding protein [Pontibacterium sinense]